MPNDLRQSDNSITQQGGVGDAAKVVMASAQPAGATPLHASSGNVANATATATLAAAAGKTTYIAGFEITGGGATAAALVLATVAGLVGGTATYTVAVTGSATGGNTPLTVSFIPPLPASAANTAIVVSVPAYGLGSSNSCVEARGYQI